MERSTGEREREREISAFDQSSTNPMVRVLSTAVSNHSFDLFLVSFHATTWESELWSARRDITCDASATEMDIACVCHGEGLKRRSVIPFALHQFQQTISFRWAIVILKNSWPSLPNPTAGGPNSPTHGSSMSTSCHILVSFNYCSQRKTLQLRF